MKRVVWSAGFVLLMSVSFTTTARAAAFADSALVVVRGHRASMRAELQTTPLAAPCGEDEYWGSGAGAPPVVTGLTIVVGGTNIWVPRSSYADLAYVTAMRCESSRKSASVVIQGGETATLYQATIRIDGGKVVSRRVQLIELPGSREDTRYRYEATR